ncbi:hypothetical protein DICPUDRAFT_76005 [Dictyostelium purpureum]|uniref:Uncharacterized protein n=1 Tax=Dictyostelium purpureum TaxID=5786 RepID=F0ZCA7_DICPU|nr:uncharacterized protein DICPUDRAFT_76005 [Dictyostelium purpureum]EGC38387.1 hypothetical protein DICPUDRAFT_76005 [Dictyostelium purpureum]|eukprot:XP_003285048.1 hypothetical protein DICPUDRAFT_76005 [Dictyostelium purpureum]
MEYPKENFKKIAKSLYQETNYRKKRELYNKINNRLKLDNKIKKEITKNKNNHSLIINNPPLLEKLFWTVFRNKPIFNTIFSNFIFKKSCSYDDLIGTQYIFSKFTNAINIIKDKIISNNYVFRNEQQDIIELFKNIIKNNQDNRDFYDILFTRSNINFTNWKKWVKLIIESGNVMALKIYIFHFKIGPQEIQNTFPLTFYHFNGYSGIKMMYHLKENYDHSFKPSIEPLVNFREINYMCNGNNHYMGYDLINILNPHLKLKQLIKLYKYIITLYYNNNNCLNNGTFKFNNLIIEINKITLNHFTKNQLNSTIRDLIIQHKTQLSNQQDVYNLIELIHNYYKIIFHLSKKYQNKLHKTRKPIEYYIYFKGIDRANGLLTSEEETENCTLHRVQDFFQATLSNKQEKIDFINKTQSLKILGHLANLILSNNDIELKNNYEKKLEPYSRDIIFKQRALESISNTKTLDFFFKKDLYFEDGNENWKYIKNKEILIYYEMLMKQSSKKFKVIEYDYDLNIYMFILYRALLNPSVYRFDSCKELRNNSYLSDTNPYLSALNIIIQKKEDIFLNYDFSIFQYFQKPTQLIYQISINISKDLFYNIRRSNISKNFDFIFILYLFYCGRIKEGIEYLEQLSTYWDIELYSQEYNMLFELPFKPLEKLIVFFIKKEKVNNFNLLIKVAAIKGYLQIFKKVFSKYGIFLNKNSSQYKKEIEFFISIARSFNNDNLVKFLTNHLNNKIK